MKSKLKQALQEKIAEYEAYITDPNYKSDIEQNAVLVTLSELRYLDLIVEYETEQPNSDILTREIMYSGMGYTPIMNGIIFRKRMSQFLNVRVEFTHHPDVCIQLETVDSGFIQRVKGNTLEDLKRVEAIFHDETRRTWHKT